MNKDDIKTIYAQTLILVNLIVVKIIFFQNSFLVITRHHYVGFGPDRCQIAGNCLPHLSRQVRTLRNEEKTRKTKKTKFRKIKQKTKKS